MADYEENLEDEGLEDDIDPGQYQTLEDANLEDELFGGDDVEEAPEPAYVPPPEPAPATNAAERKKLLLTLAKGKKRENDDGEGQRSKKAKKDKGDKGSKRSKRQQQPEEEEAGGGVEVGLLEVEDDAALQETEADKAFIDDDGVAEEERYGSEDEGAFARAEEAEEVGEEEAEAEEGTLKAVLAARKKGRKKDDESKLERDVDALVAQMHATAEMDELAVTKKEPAIHKLQALKAVEELLLQRKYHDAFLDQKGLEAMNRWLSPYADGTVPNFKVRGTLLKLLDRLPIDTTYEEKRDILMDSKLGMTCMFYYKKDDEPASTKKLAKDMVERWSRPIFADAEADAVKRERKRQQHEQRMSVEKEVRAAKMEKETEEAKARLEAKKEDKNYRSRAAVPIAGKLDFVVNPGRRAGAAEDEDMVRPTTGGSRPSPTGNLTKILERKKKKNQLSNVRHASVSVEGRGMNLMG